MTATALRPLLAGLIDYAGLFPPAALAMGSAAANYGAYRTGADAWALGRFVLPASRLEEFEAEHTGGVPDGAWRLSALAQASDADAIGAFNGRNAGRAVVDSLETKAETVDDVAALAPLARLGAVFVEIPVRDDPDALVRAIGAHGLHAKVRTGGVTPAAFPPPTDVARFLAACARHGVAFKATAGLHHPLRGEYPLTYDPGAARGTMFGYLNVFVAAMFLHHGMSEADAVPLLEERDASAIHLDAAGVRWRTHALGAGLVAEARAQFALSFGSCSFREPMDDLSSLPPT
ncbi:MAG: hypothetical protein ACYC3L_10065 [Gemmatimonadaceae bacterium]